MTIIIKIGVVIIIVRIIFDYIFLFIGLGCLLGGWRWGIVRIGEGE